MSTDTPKTDAIHNNPDGTAAAYWPMFHLAKDLERELAEAKANGQNAFIEAGTQLAKVINERDQLRAEVEVMTMRHANVAEANDKLRAHVAELEQDKARLRTKLYSTGICPDCLGELYHCVDEPFSICKCGTTEDTSSPSLLQQLRIAAKTPTT